MGRRGKRGNKKANKRKAEESGFTSLSGCLNYLNSEQDEQQLKKSKVEIVEKPVVGVDSKLRDIYLNEQSSLQQQQELGNSFVRYLPPVSQQVIDITSKRISKIFRYELFPECVYPPEKKVIGDMISNVIERNVATLLAESFSEKEENLRITLTGRSGDGKTFLLYYLANKCNDSCIFIPIHLSVIDYFVGCDENSVLVRCNLLIYSYLTHLQEILDNETTNPYKIMEQLNNGRAIKVIDTASEYVSSNTSIYVRSAVQKFAKKYGKYPVFVIDEAHKFLTSYSNHISRNRNGSLLTAFTRMAGPIPVVCCSTKIGGLYLGDDISGAENLHEFNLLQDVGIPLQQFSPSDFISFFINLFENEDVKKLSDTLLSECPVRILTYIMDEFWVVKKSKPTATSTDVLKKAIKGVFELQMPILGLKMKNHLENIEHERLKKLLFFIWTALNPNIENNVDFDSSSLKTDIQQFSLTPSDLSAEYDSFSQDMFHLGCGKPKDGIYRFSDPFFRFAYFVSMESETWNTYETYLRSCMQTVIQSHVSKKDFLFERVIGLLLLTISKTFCKQPLTNCDLFKSAKGTWLDNYTICIRSVEMTPKFSEPLIFFETTDIIACSIDENSSCDLFFSLVPINNQVDQLRVPCLSSIKFKNAAQEEDEIFKSTMIENQKTNIMPINDLMNRSNHHTERRLRLGFVANSIIGHDVKISNGDIQMLFSLNHELLSETMKTYLPKILEELMKFITITQP